MKNLQDAIELLLPGIEVIDETHVFQRLQYQSPQLGVFRQRRRHVIVRQSGSDERRQGFGAPLADFLLRMTTHVEQVVRHGLIEDAQSI